MLGSQKKLCHFAPNAFGRQIGKLDISTKCRRLCFYLEFKTSRKLRGAQYSQTVIGKGIERDCAQFSRVQTLMAFEWIDDFACQGIFQNRIDREVSARSRVLDTHIRIAFNKKRTINAPRL